ncbi:MAG: hypothetical protein F4X92_08290 [Gammaproteobacteria bacterium]|nr:hypothetical protein [Gammaproteobacteria bacterium]
MPPDSIYQTKFERIVEHSSFHLLSEQAQDFVRSKAYEMRFTQQELCKVSEIALDRLRWKETCISADWPKVPLHPDPILNKKRVLSEIQTIHEQLKSRTRSYRNFTVNDKPLTVKPKLVNRTTKELGLGRCPVASERTRCCNLMTLDAVQQCGFDCSYCSIQSFYHGDQVAFDPDFASKLQKMKFRDDQLYHIGTGQSSDSLMWGNHQGILESLCEFAEQNPNVLLELKTKSRNIGWLLDNPVPKNVICTWSMNTQVIIDHEEHLTARLNQRLDAAHAIARKGTLVGFHFHPIVHYLNWEADYTDLAHTLVQRFDPDQVVMVSLGTLTYTRSVMKTIRKRNLKSKILQMPLEECAGKLSYPEHVKLDMFSAVYSALGSWHGRVFFYLCMEPHALWKPVFGYQYDNNQDFEDAMKNAYFDKVQSSISLERNNGQE